MPGRLKQSPVRLPVLSPRIWDDSGGEAQLTGLAKAAIAESAPNDAASD